MSRFLSGLHPFALLLVALILVGAQLLGGRMVGIISKVGYPVAALLAVVGAIAAWRR